MPNGTKQVGNNFDMDKDTSMNKKIIIGTLMGCLLGATVGYSASVINVPHTFTAGTSIKASEVNANFAALAQEIASIKNTVSLNKSSDFSEIAISPISTTVGSTVIVDSKSFLISQQSNIEDPITGKKYTINFPVPSGVNDTTSVMPAKCSALMDTQIVVKTGRANNFISYIYYKGYNNGSSVGFTIQVSDNVCIYAATSDSAIGWTHAAATQMINRVTELQKYISVQEI